MIPISTPLEEYRVELITRLRAKDPDHKVYETSLPPADVPHPCYYIEEFRAPDDRSHKREVMQEVYHSVSVWHDNPDKISEVLHMLAVIGSVISDMQREGTHSYIWMIMDTGQRCMSDSVNGQNSPGVKTKYVHGIYEIHMKQIGSR